MISAHHCSFLFSHLFLKVWSAQISQNLGFYLGFVTLRMSSGRLGSRPITGYLRWRVRDDEVSGEMNAAVIKRARD
jgi:hypothetical protein